MNENINNRFERQMEWGMILIMITMFIIACLVSSCNVTRTITSTAQTVQKGDTTVVIMTKTIESYDGKVDASKFIR